MKYGNYLAYGELLIRYHCHDTFPIRFNFGPSLLSGEKHTEESVVPPFKAQRINSLDSTFRRGAGESSTRLAKSEGDGSYEDTNTGVPVGKWAPDWFSAERTFKIMLILSLRSRLIVKRFPM